MAKEVIDWTKENILKINNEILYYENSSKDEEKWRKKIEPWLTAVFQSEHLALLLGSGFTKAITKLVDYEAQGMGRITFNNFKDEINEWATRTAKTMDRGEPNFEDDLRTALELYQGLCIKKDVDNAEVLKKEIEEQFITLVKNIIEAEREFLNKENPDAIVILKSFLMSFGSRTATRERLQIFTTNYDRFIEYGCDLAVIHLLDRFIGKILPIFRVSKIDLDYHYNPPGIRGEPRYVEGVARLTKLHGSIDWRFINDQVVRASLPFGAIEEHPEIPKKTKLEEQTAIPKETELEEQNDNKKNIISPLVIYPNSSKGIETVFYPYSELFRDFASSICRPNSSLVTYGYGFGDSHINKVVEDMLTIPSTHLVVISFDNAQGRIESFLKDFNEAQYTLLLGNHFGDLRTLVNDYLPKAAIDRITERMHKIKEKRGENEVQTKNKEESDE